VGIYLWLSARELAGKGRRFYIAVNPGSKGHPVGAT